MSTDACQISKSSLDGKRFGMLVVIGQINVNRLVCRCDCGKEVEAWRTNVIQGKKQHCGCQKYVNREDLTGQRFGRLVVIGHHHGSVQYWNCKCDCGKEIVANKGNLINRNKHGTRSCGCLQREKVAETGKRNLVDITGKRFGRLVALSPAGELENGMKWNCICDCGQTTVVSSGSLSSGDTRSCGCLARELTSIRMYNPNLSEEQRNFNINHRCHYENTKWKRAVLKRDYYICQVCGEKATDAHHKKSWSQCKDNRYDVDNGVSACSGCHGEFHNLYGRNDNTEGQWNEYVYKKKFGILPYGPGNKYSVAVGDRYGRLVVTRRLHSNFKGGAMWECVCDCGKLKVASGSNLRQKQTRSCGCLHSKLKMR